MSISIYSLLNQANILNSDLKQFFDIVQLNEDKMHSNLKKSDFRKIRKALDKEDISNSELLPDMLSIVKKAKDIIKF